MNFFAADDAEESKLANADLEDLMEHTVLKPAGRRHRPSAETHTTVLVAAPSFSAILTALLAALQDVFDSSNWFANAASRIYLELKQIREIECQVEERSARIIVIESNDVHIDPATNLNHLGLASLPARQGGRRSKSMTASRRKRSSTRQRARRQDLSQKQEQGAVDAVRSSNFALKLISKVQRHIPGLMDKYYATLTMNAERSGSLPVKRRAVKPMLKSEATSGKELVGQMNCSDSTTKAISRTKSFEEAEDAKAFMEGYGNGEMSLLELIRLALQRLCLPLRENGTLLALAFQETDMDIVAKMVNTLENTDQSHGLDARSALVNLESMRSRCVHARLNSLAVLCNRHLRHTPPLEAGEDIAFGVTYHELAARFMWLCALELEGDSRADQTSHCGLLRVRLVECTKHLREFLPEDELVLPHIALPCDNVISTLSVSAKMIAIEVSRRKRSSLEAVGAAAVAACAATSTSAAAWRKDGVEDVVHEPASVTGFWIELHDRFLVSDNRHESCSHAPARLVSFRDIDVAVANLALDGGVNTNGDTTILAVALRTWGDRYERADLIVQLTVAALEMIFEFNLSSLSCSATNSMSSQKPTAVSGKRRALRRCFHTLRSVLVRRSAGECISTIYNRLITCIEQFANLAIVSRDVEELTLSKEVSNLADEAVSEERSLTFARARRRYVSVCVAYLKRREVEHDDFCHLILVSLLCALSTGDAEVMQPVLLEEPSRALAAMLVCLDRLPSDTRNIKDIRSRSAAVASEVLERTLFSSVLTSDNVSYERAFDFSYRMETAFFLGLKVGDVLIESDSADHETRDASYAYFVTDVHAHLRDHECCEAGNATFLAGRTNFYSRCVVRSSHVTAATMESQNAPFHGAERSPFQKQFETSVAQCVCCLFGVKYLANANESHSGVSVSRQTMRRTQASSYAAVSALVLGVAPHVLIAAQTVRTPQAIMAKRSETLATKREVLATLDFFVEADPTLLDACDDVKVSGLSDAATTMPSVQSKYVFLPGAKWHCAANFDEVDDAVVSSQSSSSRPGTRSTKRFILNAARRALYEMMASQRAEMETTVRERSPCMAFASGSTATTKPALHAASSTWSGAALGLTIATVSATVAPTLPMCQLPYSDPNEMVNLETIAWYIRAISASPARSELWIAAARTFEYLASPLLSLGPATGFDSSHDAPGDLLAHYAMSPFGDAMKLLDTAAKLPTGSWTSYEDFSDKWLASLAAAFADARRHMACRCWTAAVRGTSRGQCRLQSQHRVVRVFAWTVKATAVTPTPALPKLGRAAAVSLAIVLYDRLREHRWCRRPSIYHRDTHAHKCRYTSNERALADACGYACYAAEAISHAETHSPPWFEAFLLGKLAWRDGDRPIVSRHTEAIHQWRRALKQAGVDPSAADADALYRLARARFKCGERSSTLIDAFRACLRGNPKHARAAFGLAEARLAENFNVHAVTGKRVEMICALKLFGFHCVQSLEKCLNIETVLAALRTLEPFFNKRLTQIVSLWRYKCVVASLRSLDASLRKYDILRLKYFMAYLCLVAATRDFERIKFLQAQIVASKEQSRSMHAMLRATIDARVRIFLDTRSLSSLNPSQVTSSSPPQPFAAVPPRLVVLACDLFREVIDGCPLVQPTNLSSQRDNRDVTDAVVAIADATFVAVVRPCLSLGTCGATATAAFSACLKCWPVLQATCASGLQN